MGWSIKKVENPKTTAGNIKLSEILKKGGLVVNQSVVLLMKCVQVQFFATGESGRNFFYFVAKNCVNICASNPHWRGFEALVVA